MATTILEPASVGTDDGWDLGVGANKVVAVQLPDDDLTSYISESDIDVRESYNMDNLSGADVITQQVITTRALRISNGNAFYPFMISDTPTYRYGSGVAATTSFTDYDETDLAEPDGATWTQALINTTEIGVRRYAGASTTRVTSLYWTITYLTGGGFLFVGNWLAPLWAAGVGGGLLFREIAEGLRYQKTHPSYRHEFMEIRDRLLRRPRFVFQGV